VKGRSRAEILAAFEQRLDNPPEAEFDEALDQIARIARFRLEDLIRP
jgi:2-oxo-4-hydroxy-4-carboxy-5-ureidoimidazoline decarboxylase